MTIEFSISPQKVRTGLKNNKAKIAILALLIATPVFFAFQSSEPVKNDDSSSVGFNKADVMFMNMMIVHHDQAIQMAELAESRTDNQNVLELSENISRAQTEENRKMANWLRELGYQRPVRGHRMAGMASQEEMRGLRNSNGTEFDQLFSELMIRHHRGGIQMAQNFIESGKNPELIELERGMVEAQQKEIKMMRDWQEDWSDKP